MTRLEKTTHIALIGLAIIAAAVIVRRDWQHYPTPPSRESMVGKTLSLSGAEWSRSALTVVVAMSSRCHYCRASMPFYRQLAVTSARSAGQLRSIAVSFEPAAVLSRFLSDEKVQFTQVLQASFAEMRVSGTPTLFLVGADGKVRSEWLGQLDSTAQGDVGREIEAACGTCRASRKKKQLESVGD